jgi:hypothetical protein
LFESGQVDYLRLLPAPGPDSAFMSDARLGTISCGAEYRASLQMAIWRKDVLHQLLLCGESPWEFEIQGSKRSAIYKERFMCVKSKDYGISYVFSAVADGMWSRSAYDYAEREGIDIAFDELPRKSCIRQQYSKLKNCAYRHYRRILKYHKK